MIPHRSARLVSLALTVVLSAPVVAADPSASPDQDTSSPVPGASSVPGTPTLPGGGATFGIYTLVPLLSDEQPYQGPTTPHSMTNVSVVRSDVQDLLKDPAVKQALRRQGFVIVPSDIPRFSAAYDSQVYSGTPVFMTTDAAYDAWHLVFDRVLRGMETQRLLPRLEELVTGMLANARSQANEVAGTPLADPAQRVVTLLQLAGRELGLKVGALERHRAAELALIKAHDAAGRARHCSAPTSTTPCTPPAATTRARRP